MLLVVRRAGGLLARHEECEQEERDDERPATCHRLGAVATTFVSSFFVPALNAPVLSLFSLRPPPPLRAKAMTALITANAVARLAGAGLRATFVLLAAGLTGAAALFAAVVARETPTG